jgi:hypothetical protein
LYIPSHENKLKLSTEANLDTFSSEILKASILIFGNEIIMRLGNVKISMEQEYSKLLHIREEALKETRNMLKNTKTNTEVVI